MKKSNARANGEKVNANELQSVVGAVVVGAPAGNGVTAGGSGRASVLPAVGALYNKVKQNSNDQTDAAIVRECWDYAKLKSALCACFAAAEWVGEKADATRAMLDAGLASGAINEEQYNSMWKAAAKNSGVDLTPPACSVGDVLELIRGRYASAWSAVVGCPADELTADVCKVYNTDGVALSGIDTTGTACQIITDILSYRFVVAARRAAAWSAAVLMNDAVNKSHDAGVACFAAGLSEEDALSLVAGRVRAYYAAEREREFIKSTEQHNARVDVSVLNVLLVDALVAGRYQLADKIRGRRRRALAVAGGRK